jgi:3'-phosphoadenosine 5'-phosphosulfate sulfotransferase (PAPS reductase)/FAD synthetase
MDDFDTFTLEPGVSVDSYSAVEQTEPEVVLDYDRYVIAFSGGKDSLACLLHLLDCGVDRDKIELHHHLVDGREGSDLFDWPITEGYCEAIAKALEITLTFSHRVGGLEREMLRENSSTAPVCIPYENGYKVIGGDGPLGTRRKFPQVSANLSVRWCSAAAKIDVFARYMTNHPKFREGRTLVLTGERAEESKARAHYKRFEPHRTDLRNGRGYQRYIDAWRPVHAWSEQKVWDLIQRWRITSHPAYYLGFGRTSCRGCIFGSKDQWATVREIAPDQFNQIASREREFKVTIHRSESVIERANAGTPYDTDPFWVEIANSRTFSAPVFIDPWVLPKGAFGDSCGPT